MYTAHVVTFISPPNPPSPLQKAMTLENKICHGLSLRQYTFKNSNDKGAMVATVQTKVWLALSIYLGLIVTWQSAFETEGSLAWSYSTHGHGGQCWLGRALCKEAPFHQGLFSGWGWVSGLPNVGERGICILSEKWIGLDKDEALKFIWISILPLGGLHFTIRKLPSQEHISENPIEKSQHVSSRKRFASFCSLPSPQNTEGI